ncbi:MAG: endopeptidase [Brachymonas sp.]
MSSYDPTDLRSQERAKADSAIRSRLEKDTEEGDVKWLMGSKRGRRIVWRILDQAGVFRLSFNTNAMAMAFAEGNRNGGLRLMGVVTSLCPDLYTSMLKEAHERRNPDDGSSHNGP